jgi:hypothetical protein
LHIKSHHIPHRVWPEIKIEQVIAADPVILYLIHAMPRKGIATVEIGVPITTAYRAKIIGYTLKQGIKPVAV